MMESLNTSAAALIRAAYAGALREEEISLSFERSNALEHANAQSAFTLSVHIQPIAVVSVVTLENDATNDATCFVSRATAAHADATEGDHRDEPVA